MKKKTEITKKKTNVNTKANVKKTNAKSIKNKKESNKSKKIMIFCLIGIFIVILLIITLVFFNKEEKLVITIDNVKYTESDFNMYAYLIKYDYFGINGTNISEETLNTQVSNDSEQTIGEYLKEKTISKIKVSSSILRIAKENNITLNEDDLKEIETEKEKFIETLGGNKEFKKMLKDNDTDLDAYMEVAKINKLYDIIYNSLYKEGKRNDLTLDELDKYTKSYQSDYVKIKQIILLKKDLETNTYLSDTTLNQKEILANAIAKQAKETDSFDSLIIKYSEGYKDKVVSEYYLKDELVSELKTVVNSLKIGDISGVVSTEYAYHIVIREELDDSKLEEYLNSKREEKLVDSISDNLKKIAVINGDYLEEITVK